MAGTELDSYFRAPVKRAQIVTFFSVVIGCSGAAMWLRTPAAAVVGNAAAAQRDAQQPTQTPRSSSPSTLEEVTVSPRPHPLAGLSRASMLKLLHGTPEELGSISIGEANRGSLLNPILLPDNPGWRIVNPKHAFATQETVEYLEHALHAFRGQHPDAPPLYIGDLSDRDGGFLSRHRSHQSGRDVDLGYFYLGGPHWYKPATADTLDRELTWSFLKALISETDIEYIFIERPVQMLLHEHALRRGEDAAWLDTVFESPSKRDTLIRHARGHSTHMHVRFHNNLASETARRLRSQFGSMLTPGAAPAAARVSTPPQKKKPLKAKASVGARGLTHNVPLSARKPR